MTSIMIEIGQLVVSIDTEHDYPDVIDDLAGRAKVLLDESVMLCGRLGWNPFGSTLPNQLEPEA